MFQHSFLYALKTTIKSKGIIVWSLLFPIALTTFMYMAFGNIYESDMVFSAIKTNIIVEQKQEGFHEFLNVMASLDEPFIEYEITDEATALKALENNEIEAVIYENDNFHITFAKSDYKQALLKSLIEEFIKVKAILSEYDFSNSKNLLNFCTQIEKELKGSIFLKEKSPSNHEQNVYNNYFFAILAMCCLYAAFGSLSATNRLQPNQTYLGMRRNISCTPKSILIAAEFVALWIVISLIEFIAYGYMNLIGVRFTGNHLAALGILVVGSAFSIAFGALIGLLPKLSLEAKNSICVAITMLLSIMADLCVSGIKDTIEHTCPIINRLSPAALMTDSFYALSVYDDYSRYGKNLLTLTGLTIILLAICYILLRRKKSASL